MLGLAAQQTLGNLFAGMVLLSARPFRVGERVRLQAGALGGIIEGIVSSLGLLYTTLARGEDRIMIPNNVVLVGGRRAAAGARHRSTSGCGSTPGSGPARCRRSSTTQITTPTRQPGDVLLEEIDGDEVVVRVQATPEHASDGAQLADEVIAALARSPASTRSRARATTAAGSGQRWPIRPLR